jgi:hypothetical protein
MMPPNKTMPSVLPIMELKDSNNRNAEMISITGISRLMTAPVVFTGWNTAVKPSTRAMLQILLPMTLPKAIMLLPLTAETRLTTSSGADVPNATTVNPITIGVSPMLPASADDPRTSQPAP